MTQRRGGRAKPVLDAEERMLLNTIVAQTVESLHIGDLVREVVRDHLKGIEIGNTGRVLGAQPALATEYGQAGVPQPAGPQDQFSVAREAIGHAIKRYEADRSRWLRAQDAAHKTSPLDPQYSAVIAELHYTTANYIDAAHTLVNVDSGMVFG